MQVVFLSLRGLLMEGGLNILNFTLFLFPSLLFSPFRFFLYGCALGKCTHDPVSATAVHTFNLYDIMLYFWD